MNLTKLRLVSTALDGRTVTLTARQNGQDAGPITVNDWGTPLTVEPTASVTLSVKRMPLKTAPESVFLEVTGWDGFDVEAGPDMPLGVDARHHELIYLWDYGDPGARYNVPVKVLDAWRDSNVGFGPYVAHVYRKPGTYKASVLVIEPSSGKTARASVEMVVQDPDVVFAGKRTIYISPSANYATAPEGSIRHTSRFGATGIPSGVPLRFMFRRGEVDLWPDYIIHGANTANQHWVDDPKSTGARPICKLAASSRIPNNGMFWMRTDNPAKEYAFRGLEFQGDWDAATETGKPYNFYHMESEGQFLWDNCKLTGFRAALNTIQKPDVQPRTWFTIHDTEITNWQNFGIWAEGGRNWALMGAMIAQNVDAAGGGGKTQPPAHNEHGPIRYQPDGPAKAHHDCCDFFSRNGWIENFRIDGKAVRTQQPCVRWNQWAEEGSFLNSQRSSHEGGFPNIACGRFNGSATPCANSMLIDKNIFVGSHMTRAFVTMDGGGATIRNCLGIFPDVERLNGIFDPRGFLEILWVPEEFRDQFAPPIRIYSNTMVNLMSDANKRSGDKPARVPWVGGDDGIPTIAAKLDIRYDNNLEHQPNIGTPFAAHGPLDRTPLWAPREKGYRDAPDFPTFLAQTKTPATTVWSGKPMAGSSAIGAATSDETGYDGLSGKPRPVHASIGAWEMDG